MSIYDERVAIVLGLVSLAALIAVFASCRSCMTVLNRLKLGKLLQGKAYLRFNQYHAYYWLTFGIFLVAHFITAFMHTGFPQAGDPDAPIHWAILGLGFCGALTAGTLFFSCRITPRFITMATSKKPMANSRFKAFFQTHAYYWWLILLMAAGHFTVAYIHAGIWPR